MQNHRTIPNICQYCGIPYLARDDGFRRFCSRACYSRSPHKRQTVIDFYTRIQAPTPEECSRYTGPIDPDGYGTFGLDGKKWRAHRLAYTLAYGPITPGKYICHTCDNKWCVGFAHLWEGTHDDNMHDAVRKGRTAKGDRNGLRLHPESVRRGEGHAQHRLTNADVLEIRARYTGERGQLTHLATEFGVAYQHIDRIVRRINWTNI